jgi:uncharacterized protein
MSKPFLGRGIGFPLQLANRELQTRSDLSGADYEESVRQSVWIILGTARGERVMRPDFGCDIDALVFEMNTPATAGRIAKAVRDALLRWEPRIDVVDVDVATIVDQDGQKVLISVEYRVRATNNQFNLVYPFYLERRAG